MASEWSKSETRKDNRDKIGHLSCWYTNATSLNNKYEELLLEIDIKNQIF